MLIRFDCGCIGFSKQSKDGSYWIVRQCDNDRHRNEYCLSLKDMHNREIEEELSQKETDTLFLKLAALIGDGYDLRRIKKALSI